MRTMRLVSTIAAAAAMVLPGLTHARPLPNVDALAQVAPARPVPAVRQDARVSRAHVDARLGRPSFVWLRSGVPILSVAAAGMAPESAARDTLNALASHYGMNAEDVADATTHSVERIAGGGHLVRFKNRHEGVEVFREFPGVILDARNQPVAVGGAIGPTRHARVASRAANPFTLTAADAIARALGDYNFDPSIVAALGPVPISEEIWDSVASGYQHFVSPPDRKSADGAVMGGAARAKRVWFRMPEGLVAAWYVELNMLETFVENNAPDHYSYVIAADDGRLLFRHNLTADVAFTYRAYAETTSPFLPYPGPQGRGHTPHPTGTNDGSEPAILPSANLVTLQNGPISTNDPWLPLGATKTTGNNVEAWSNQYSQLGTNDFTLDVDPQECNLGVAPTADFRACTTAATTFDHSYNFSLEALANKTQSAAGVTNLFYLVNWLHDWFYDAGFKEVDGNAQASNYGRGGTGGDRLNAQAQDIGGVNNANMFTPADGASPRMRMYRFTGPTIATLTLTPPGGAVTPLGVATTFGPLNFSISAQVVLAQDAGGVSTTDGCETITNAGAVAGRIALVDRGTCAFVIKVKNAQNAGAIGVLIANNSPTNTNMSGTDATIVIPSLVIPQSTGVTLKANLLGGPVTAAMARVKEPDIDGAFDNGVIAHEWGHYLSNRLVADANGLNTNHSDGLGEGWADFVALMMMLKSGDNLNGTYAVGGYDMGASQASPNSGYYVGFRRYPYSRDFTRNPLTFKHIADENALPASPAPIGGGPNSEVHNTGEVWATMLWQCYTALVGDSGRLTFAEAQARMKAYLVTGLKLTPASPTLLEARDGVLAAMAANDAADLALCANAFAQRGAGANAVAPDRFSANNNGVVESFAAGAEVKIVSVAFEPRAALYCDADSALDNNETAYVAVTVKNIGTAALSGASVALSSGNTSLTFPDGALPLPTLDPLGASATVRLRVGLAGASAPGGALVTASVTHASVPGASADVGIPLHLDRTAASSASDDVEGETTLWTPTVAIGVSSLQWVRAGDVVPGRYWRAPTGGSAGLTWLTSPPLTVSAPGTVTLTIVHRHKFEMADWDGGVIEVSFDNGATWADLDSLVSAGYSGPLNPSSGNPLGGRQAYLGQSAGYPAFNTVAFAIPASAGTMRVRFGAATDSAVADVGWDLDSIGFSGIANTPFESAQPNAGQCVAVSAFAGSPQVASVSMAFGTQLVARVLGAGSTPVQGATVTFTAPSSGASGTFAGGGTTATAVTNADGRATAPAFTANATGGSFAVTASAGLSTATFTLTNVTLTQLLVTKAGTGSGTVSSSSHPGTIDCGSDCSENYVGGLAVTLAAAPATGSVFTGWSGACTGTGACNVTMDSAKTVTATFDLPPADPPRLGNLSTRMQVLGGNDVLIGGFVIGGSANKTVVVRARGPSLIPFGIPNALANPQLQLVNSATQGTVATNDDWQSASNAVDITASGFAPSNGLESAVLVSLPPGAYTAIVSGVGNATGVGIVEVFEVDGPGIPLTNLSTRGRVLTGNDVMIGGFVITGSGSQTVVVRARGPSLIPFGIANALANPQLQLVRASDQATIATNDDWQSASNAADITASGFAPSSNLESALLVTLPPGAYTAIVTGVANGTGVGIVEVFSTP